MKAKKESRISLLGVSVFWRDKNPDYSILRIDAGSVSPGQSQVQLNGCKAHSASQDEPHSHRCGTISYSVAVVAVAGGKSQSSRVQLHSAMFVSKLGIQGSSCQPSRSRQALLRFMHAIIRSNVASCTTLHLASCILGNGSCT